LAASFECDHPLYTTCRHGDSNTADDTCSACGSNPGSFYTSTSGCSSDEEEKAERSPHPVTDVNKLEAVRRRFTKRLKGMESMEYPSRLKALAIYCLQKRRVLADLIFTYKVLFGLNDMNSSELFTLNNNYGETRKLNPYKLQISYCRVDTRKYFFSKQIETMWNSLKARDSDFTSLYSFKLLLRQSDITYLNS